MYCIHWHGPAASICPICVWNICRVETLKCCLERSCVWYSKINLWKKAEETGCTSLWWGSGIFLFAFVRNVKVSWVTFTIPLLYLLCSLALKWIDWGMAGQSLHRCALLTFLTLCRQFFWFIVNVKTAWDCLGLLFLQAFSTHHFPLSLLCPFSTGSIHSIVPSSFFCWNT